MIDKLLGPIVGSLITGQASRDNAAQATAANKEAMQNRHQWQVEDLKAAGLNPILSSNLGGSSGMPAAMAAPPPDYGATITNALQTGSNVKKQDAEIKKILMETGLTRIQQDKAAKEVEKLIFEVNQIEWETVQKGTEYHFLMKNQEFIEAGAALKRIGLSGDTLAKILADKISLPSLKTLKEWYKKLRGKK
jgi:hypothetical protein